MTESKHTPGPWHIDDYAQIIAGKSVIGRVYSGDIFPNEDLPECTANGYLIAAAPETAAERDRLKEINKELVEALKDLLEISESYHCQLFGVDGLDVCRKSGNTEHPLNKALQVLSKSKGQ